ncbi:MAG: beta-lactamase family protein, partial [Pseudomonadota bacterium]|nr:beta-lactamase family protein [Pseudomonadota bacterium]
METLGSFRKMGVVFLAIILYLVVIGHGSSPSGTRVQGEPSSQAVVVPRQDYAAAVEMLARFITHEMADKELPALSIALVDDQQIVWAKGFGFADPKGKVPATAETIYRVGSVSKLFTDIAVMQLVEQRKID